MAKKTKQQQTAESPENLATDELPASPPQQSLEQFLAETFGGEAPSTSENGLPSLGWLKEHFKTKSAAIRYLHETCKATPAQISKLLSVKYQHVRNVITTPLKRGPNEDYRLPEPSATAEQKAEPANS